MPPVSRTATPVFAIQPWIILQAGRPSRTCAGAGYTPPLNQAQIRTPAITLKKIRGWRINS